MALPLAAIGIGAGLSALGGLLGGRAKKKAADKAAEEQRKRTAQNDALIAQLMGTGAGRGENDLYDFVSQYRNQPGINMEDYMIDASGLPGYGDYNFDAAQTSLDDLGLGDFGVPGLDFNTGQDGILQYLRGNGGYNGVSFNPNAVAKTNLEDITAGNTNFDVTDYSKFIKSEEDRELNDQLVALRGGAGSLGARYGSAMLDLEGQARVRSQEKVNARREAAAMAAYQAAQDRRIGAAGQLNAMDSNILQGQIANMEGGLRGSANILQALGLLTDSRNAANTSRIAAGGLKLDALQSLLQGRMANTSALNEVGLSNKRTALESDRYKNTDLLSILTSNASNKLNATSLSNNRNNDIAAMLQSIMAAENARRGQNVGLLGLRTGQGTPGPNPYAGGGWDTIGDIGSLIPMLMSLRGGGSGGSATRPAGGVAYAGPNYG